MGVRKSVTIYCLNCDTQIRVKERPSVGQIVICPECEDYFEVVNLRPLEIDWAYGDQDQDDGNWDDDYLDDEEYIDDDDYVDDDE